MRNSAWFLLFTALSVSGCGYNSMQTQDEQVKSAWSEVLNQYQRRADLIPNLVATVKGFAAQEQQVLLGVTEARAKVGSIQATPELVNDPEAFKKFLAPENTRCQYGSSVCLLSIAAPIAGTWDDETPAMILATF